MPHPAGPVILVILDVEERLAVGSPRYVARRVVDAVAEVLAGLDFPDAHLVEFRALVVVRPGDEFVIRAVDHRTELEKIGARRFGIAIDEHSLFPREVARLAAIPRMLSSLNVADVIGVVAVRQRNA